MRPTTLPLYLFFLVALPVFAGNEAVLRTIAAHSTNPEGCERQQLLSYLKHEDVRVRSAALDLLELVTGSDFGLDSWLQPSDVPAEVQAALAEWAAAEELVGDVAKAPEPAQLADAVVLLRSADPDTQRRICLRFGPWKPALAAALQREIKENAQLTERERDNLRCSLYRLQLQAAIPAEVGQVAPLLASHARNDILNGLESLRKAGKAALPVLMEFVESADGLVREVAVDVLLQTGGAQAYKIIMPRLMAEQDRNILQIAARRAPDSQPLPQIIDFLNHCAAQEDEDVAVAALEALADMEADDDSDDSDGLLDADVKMKGKSSAGAEHAMPEPTCLQLLKSPNWRVRAAMLRALKSKASFMPTIRSEALQNAILASMKDEDETVRMQAMEVLYKRNLAVNFIDELEQFAIVTPTAAPFVVYLLCEKKSELSPGLLDLVSRFGPEDVDKLVYYDEEYDTVFNQDSHSSTTVIQVLNALISNPDPRVRRRVMSAWGRHLFCCRQEWADAFVNWLQDTAVPEEEKIEPLKLLAFRITDNDRQRVSDAALVEWLHREVESPSVRSRELQQMIAAAFLSLRPVMAAPLIDVERLEQLPVELLSDILEDSPTFILKFKPEFASKLIQHNDFLAFSELRSAVKERVGEHNGELAMFLLALDLSEEQRISLLTAVLESLDDSDSSISENGVVNPCLEQALQQKDYKAALTVYAVLSAAPQLEPQVVDIIAALPEPQRAALECLRDIPSSANAVEPWARKYHDSPHAAVRRSVAGCLLPIEHWHFFLPREGELPPYASTDERYWQSRDAERSSCPVSLIRLVQTMQHDPDPYVAITACCSVLYRTGDCNRTRLTELLKQMSAIMGQDVEPRQNVTPAQKQMMRDDARVLELTVMGVWSRWNDYRSGTREYFKLKGSPKKLRPGIEKHLAELARVFDSYPWSVIDEVEDKLPKRRGSSSASADIQPHEFDYPVSTVEVAPTAPPAPELPIAGDDGADEEDAEETAPVATAGPVRVEFFHKDGCDVCEQVQRRLDELKVDFPDLEIVSYNVESQAGLERNSVLSARFGVPPRDRRKAPSLFAEAGCLLGEEATNPVSLKGLLAASAARTGRSEHLAANPAETSPELPADNQPAEEPTVKTPTPEPAPAIEDRLAATTATEQTAAAGEQLWEHVRSYGMLAVGGLVTLIGLCLLLFGRSKEDVGE